jgi:hypothetical protein
MLNTMKEDTMNRYTALDGKGRSIVTVVARDEQDARRRIREQLDRPGRRDFYRLWVEGGECIQRR